MALTVAEIVAKIRAEGAEQVVGEMKKAEGATSGFANSVSNFGKGMAGVGKTMSIGLTLPLIGLGIGAVKAASDLNEATSAAKTTYGDASKAIIAYSKQSATAVGLSSEQYLSAATQVGVFGNAAGLTGRDLSDFGQSTIGAAADLASFYNAPVPEALEAIRAGLTGETEPLRRFGIMMSDDAIKQQAMADGIWDGTGAMTEQQKVLARHNFILANMGAASGDFEKTQGGLANQTRILKAEFKDFLGMLGQALLPIVSKVVSAFVRVLETLRNMSPHTRKIVLIVGALVAAIGPLLVIFGTLISAAAPAVGVISGIGGALGLLLGPVGLVVLALAALGIAYKTNFMGFADLVNGAVASVVDWLGRLVDYLTPLAQYFAYAATSGDVFNKSLDKVPGPLRNIAAIIGAVIGGVSAFIQVLAGGGSLSEAWDTLTNKFTHGEFGQALSGIKDQLLGLGSTLAGLAGDLAGWAFNVGLPKLGGAILDMAGDLWGWLKDQLPGLASLAGDIAEWGIDVALPAVGGAIVTGFTTMWDWLKSGVSWLADNIDFAGIGAWAIDVALPTVGGAIVDAFTSVWEWIKSKIPWLGGGESPTEAAYPSFDVSVPTPGIAGTIVGAFASVWDWIKDKIGWLVNLGDCLVPDFDVSVNLPKIAGGIVDAFSSVCEWVMDKVSWLKNIGSIPSPDLSLDIPLPKITGTIIDAFASLWDAAKSVAPWLVESYIKLIKLELSIGAKIVGAIIDQFPSMWDAAKSAAAWLADTITQVVSLSLDIGGAVVNVAADVLSTFENAIATALGVVKDAAGWTWRHSVGAVVDVVSGGGGAEAAAAGAPAAPTVVDPTAAALAAQALEDALARITGAVSGIGTQLTTMGNDFLAAQTTVQNVATQMNTDLGTFTGSMGVFATVAGDSFNKNLYTGMRAGQDSASNVYTQMGTDATGFHTKLSGIATAAGNAFNQNLYAGMRAGQNSAQAVFNQIGSYAGTFSSTLSTLATNAGNRFNQNLYTGMRAGQDSAKSVFNQIASDAGSFSTNLATLATSAGNAFKNGISNGMNAAVSAARSAASQISSAIGNLAGGAYDVGYSIGQGINNGIGAWTSAIAATASAAVSGAISAARQAAASASPSKKGRRVGSEIGEGFHIGLGDWLRPLRDMGASLADTMLNAFGSPSLQASLGALDNTGTINPTPAPLTPNRGGAGASGGNVFIVLTRSELAAIFDAADVVQVLTTPHEITAAMGG